MTKVCWGKFDFLENLISVKGRYLHVQQRLSMKFQDNLDGSKINLLINFLLLHVYLSLSFRRHLLWDQKDSNKIRDLEIFY